MTEPIHDVIERWHRHLSGDLSGGLDDLLDDDCVFVSPIVFTPQRGKELTKMYLDAASQTLPGDGQFRYTKQVLSGSHAVLEFETTVEDKYVNGVDIITCNDEGRITEFRVMIRPLQAVNLVHAQMKAMLETMGAPGN